MHAPLQTLARLVACSALSLATAAHAAAPANLLLQSSSAAWGPQGATPPRPWQHSDRDDGKAFVRAADHNGASWIELRDASPEHTANLRQEFVPLSAGRLTFKIALHRQHVGEFGIYLGQGNASAPVERIVELKLSSRGMLYLGSGGERINTNISLGAGMSDHLCLDFEPVGHDLRIRLGRVGPDGAVAPLAEYTAPQRAHRVNRLRATTDMQPVGARVLLSDLILVPLP